MANINLGGTSPKLAANKPAASTTLPDLTLKGPPLPVGKIMVGRQVPGMTELEASTLSAAGWGPGKALTPELQAAVRAAQAEAQAAAREIPVDPATPPVQFKVKPIEDLSHNEQI